MLISIIIPIYKVELYIERCLLSVLNQTYCNIEIILVNDSTPDNSMGIVDSFLQSNPSEDRIKIFNHEVNKGLSEARNTGIMAAKGEYVYFLDSDDEITLDCIETLVNNCTGIEIVMGGVQKEDKTLHWNNYEGKYIGDEIYDAYFSGKLYDIACNKLIKRGFLLKNKLFFKPDLIHEDLLWSYQVAMVSSSIVVINTPTYTYYVREGSLNTNITKKNIENVYYIFRTIRGDLIDNNFKINENVVKFFVNRLYIYKFISVKNANLSFKEFRGLNINLLFLNFKNQDFKTIYKYVFLRLPNLAQFFLINFKIWVHGILGCFKLG